MKAIVKLRSLRLELRDPDTIADLDAIRLLSDLCESLLKAYINPHLSLTEQVTYLSKFAHLSFAFFRLYCTHYMLNQLYGDSQCMVKNAIFCTVKQQALDLSQLFHLFELGDDRLEKLFGCIRMLGAHDSGMHYSQGVDHLGHAVDIDAALAHNPDLDSGQRCLKVTCTAVLDHLNIASWDGDACVNNISLPCAWAAGRHVAQESILSESSHMPRESAAFEEIFRDGKIDLLCPFEGGKYPGVDDEEPDRSLPPDTTEKSAHNSVPTTSATATAATSESSSRTTSATQMDATVSDSTTNATVDLHAGDLSEPSSKIFHLPSTSPKADHLTLYAHYHQR